MVEATGPRIAKTTRQIRRSIPWDVFKVKFIHIEKAAGIALAGRGLERIIGKQGFDRSIGGGGLGGESLIERNLQMRQVLAVKASIRRAEIGAGVISFFPNPDIGDRVGFAI